MDTIYAKLIFLLKSIQRFLSWNSVILLTTTIKISTRVIAVKAVFSLINLCVHPFLYVAGPLYNLCG